MVAAVILILLVLVDITVLKDKGMVDNAGQADKPKKVEELEELPVGIGIGNIAPSFTLKDLDGKEASLGDYKGKKILLNFWASWCPPCRAEMPDMESFYQKYKDEGYTVIAVNAASTEKNSLDAPAFIEKNELTFPVLVDEKGSIGALYNVISLPTSYFIDSDGVIRNKVTGPMSEERIVREMTNLP